MYQTKETILLLQEIRTLHNNQEISPRRQLYIYIYTPNIGAPKYIKQILRQKGKKLTNTIIVGDFITPQVHQWTGVCVDRHIYKVILLSHKKMKFFYLQPHGLT